MSRFFILRPIFAWVIAIVIMLAGILSLLKVPLSQYPDIALPQINVSASYQGASAKIIEESVTQIIEQGMNGLDNLKYMSANSANGNANVTLVFEAGTDPDIAQVQVQNKVQAVTRSLPQEVQNLGVRVNKANNTNLLVAVMYSKDDSWSNAALADYVNTNLIEPISRIDGVGATRGFGSPFAMRIWLNADKMAAYNLMPNDVISAIRTQNAQVSAGNIGAPPVSGEIGISASVTAQTRLSTVPEFENIIIKNNPQGSPILIRDVARVEIGAESYQTVSTINAKHSAGMAVSLAPGANALKTADLVIKRLDELKKQFPEQLDYALPVDSTQFVKLSIKDVLHALIEAVILVFIVIFVFLQNWRATIIPTIAVPVVLLGTVAILGAFGFSINTLTMFGLVMAIGLLVDDAIVVVENVERVMHEENLDARDATIKTMDEITGALIGIASVLAAMFIPMAFFGGTQGIIYRQFSITLVSAMALSVVVALILTPPLCAILLRRNDIKKIKPKRKSIFGTIGGAFNHGFAKLSNYYVNMVQFILKKVWIFLGIYGLLIGGLIWFALALPSSFLPNEDQGALTIQVQMPPGTKLSDTEKIVHQVRDFILKQDSVRFAFASAGGGGGGPAFENTGQVVARLKPFEERHGKENSVFALQDKIRKEFGKINSANINPSIPPPVRELGNASGFNFYLEDIGGVGHETLQAAKAQFLAAANENSALSGVRATGQDDTLQLNIDVNKQQAGAYGLQIGDINALLSTVLGGTYVNDFIDRGRTKRVYVQGDSEFRMQPQDLERWFVRNNIGQMIPFSSIAMTNWQSGPPRLERYNGFAAIEIQGQAAEGISNGTAMAEVEKIINTLPNGIGFEWTGLSLQEKESGQQAPFLYAISLVFIFLLLAALYESWKLPLAVVIVIPLGVFGAVLATYLRGLDNDIYFQVGLLATMGLVAKNAILILEFAKSNYENGMGLYEATIEAVRIRFRPIIMTSLAFTFGIMPLVFADSAGAATQHAIGTGLLGGVIAASILSVFFVPLFFVLINNGFVKSKANFASLRNE